MKHCLRELQQRSPIILFGASLCGKEYLEVLNKNGISIECFCDDNTDKQQSGFLGYKVISVDQLADTINDRNGGGVIVISSYGPLKLYNRLKKFDASLLSKTKMVDFYLWEDGLDYYRYFTDHLTEIEKAYALLADDKSRLTFKNLLQYKISRRPDLIEQIKDDAALQYFDPAVVELDDHEVLLDLGAYIGDTTESFIKRTSGKYDKIIALEPDKGNFERLMQNTRGMKNVECFQCGASSHDGTVSFRSDSLYTSQIDEAGEDSIEVLSVDSLLNGQRVTLIKADIEGAETDMLIGARETIMRYKPKLAISAYHRKEDIFKLINLITGYRSDYRFFMRHYTEMPIDTVLYAT